MSTAGGLLTRTLRVRGRSLRIAEREGDRSRIPLVMCNGIGSSLELFNALITHLDPTRPLLRFDVPGIGDSPQPVLPYRFPSLAMTLHALLDRLGYERFDVLGVSWGGGLAQQLAFQYPHPCRRLVLVAPSSGWMMVPARPTVLARMATPRRHRDAAHAARIAGKIYGGSARSSPIQAIELLHASAHAPSMRGYLYQLTAMAGWSSLPFLPFIRQPALLVAGRDDPIIPLINATIMASLLPHATLHIHEGGHLAILTEATELAPVVDAFLDRVGPTQLHPAASIATQQRT